MKVKGLLVIVSVALIFSSCDLLNKSSSNGNLSDSDIIDGLKTALKIGADSAASNLMKVNGYYKGNPQFVKIPLPPQAADIRNLINSNSTLKQISSSIGLDNAFENVILSVNRAAEDAAKQSAPIFEKAITSLTISQGWDILHGTVPADSGTKAAAFDSTAATEYLKGQTYTDLTNLYSPKIDTSLQKDIVGSVSAYDAWNTLTSTYNTFMGNTIVQTTLLFANINLPSSINTDIGVFSTQKALDGLFYKVGQQEKKIRKNPYDWAVDIIQKVFGSLTN